MKYECRILVVYSFKRCFEEHCLHEKKPHHMDKVTVYEHEKQFSKNEGCALQADAKSCDSYISMSS